MGAKALALACLLALPLAACGTAGRERAASAVSERFHAALESEDGAAACAELSKETASKLEQQEKKPCDEAILGLDIPKGGSATVRRVYVRSAYVRLPGGSADFLDEGPGGWRIAASGCRRTATGQPYDCELEG